MSDFDALLAIESEARLWDAEVRDIKLWSGVRFNVLQTMLASTRDYTPHIKGTSRWLKLKPQLWTKYLNTLCWLFFQRQHHSTLFFKRYRDNGVHRYFFERIPSALIIEESGFGRVSDAFSRANRYSAILQDALFFLRLGAARRIKLLSQEEHTITEYSQYLQQQYTLVNPVAIAQSIRNHVIYTLSLRDILARYVLPRIDGRVAFVQTACYLGSNAAVTRMLHEHDFKVIEAQHGMVHQTHPAYNYPDEVLNDESHPARQYLPDVFLSFGRYWEQQIRIPCQQVSIGYPALMENAGHLRESATVDPKQILIVSQGTVTHKMVEITHALSRACPDYHLIFKLHPGEIGFVERYESLLELPNVIIKKLDNIHALIAESALVIGATSTTLFEAVLFPNKRIFVLANDAVPDGIGTAFSSTDELITLIQNDSTGNSNYDAQELWADNWQIRIADFLSSSGLTAQ